jgi:hypothetical protein
MLVKLAPALEETCTRLVDVELIQTISGFVGCMAKDVMDATGKLAQVEPPSLVT